MMKFKDKEHEEFYNEIMKRSHHDDPWHRALFYALGISGTTRNLIDSLFDFNEDCIRPEGIYDPAQTGTSRKVTRLAFNLFTDGCPESDPDTKEDYLPSEIFNTSLLPWMIEALKIRFGNYA